MLELKTILYLKKIILTAVSFPIEYWMAES